MIASFLLGVVLYTVSPNVLVSTDRPNRNHWEVVMGANPSNAKDLIACSMLENASHEYDQEYATLAYLSHDGGQTWKAQAEHAKSWDPDCGYGMGAAYFTRMYSGSSAKHAPKHTSTLDLLRTDGHGVLRTFLTHPLFDRPYFAVGPNPGPCAGTLSFYGITDDSGKPGAAQGAMTAFHIAPKSSTVDTVGSVTAEPGFLGNGPEIFLLDGTVLFAYENGPLATNHWTIRAVTLDRCGSHVQGVHKISPSVSNESTTAEAGGVPVVAQDQSHSLFRNRIYAAWPDEGTGSAQILISHSVDDGRTWSASAVVSDASLNAGVTSFAHLSAIAVSVRGVVGVSWYDNRDAPRGIGATERFAVSFDGGQTFLPSVRVSEGQTSFPYDSDKIIPLSTAFLSASARGGIGGSFGLNGRYSFQGGDTAGLAADADGDFHALWVDNRGGISQLWTSRIAVPGSAIRNGEADLARLDDVSKDVRFFFDDAMYDGKSHDVTMNLVAKNIGHAVLATPLEFRVSDLESMLGDVRITNASNEMEGRGAVVKLSASGSDLRPGQTTPPTALHFHIDRFSMAGFKLDDYKALDRNVVSVRGQVFGTRRPELRKKK